MASTSIVTTGTVEPKSVGLKAARTGKVLVNRSVNREAAFLKIALEHAFFNHREVPEKPQKKKEEDTSKGKKEQVKKPETKSPKPSIRYEKGGDSDFDLVKHKKVWDLIKRSKDKDKKNPLNDREKKALEKVRNQMKAKVKKELDQKNIKKEDLFKSITDCIKMLNAGRIHGVANPTPQFDSRYYRNILTRWINDYESNVKNTIAKFDKNDSNAKGKKSAASPAEKAKKKAEFLAGLPEPGTYAYYTRVVKEHTLRFQKKAISAMNVVANEIAKSLVAHVVSNTGREFDDINQRYQFDNDNLDKARKNIGKTLTLDRLMRNIGTSPLISIYLKSPTFKAMLKLHTRNEICKSYAGNLAQYYTGCEFSPVKSLLAKPAKKNGKKPTKKPAKNGEAVPVVTRKTPISKETQFYTEDLKRSSKLNMSLIASTINVKSLGEEWVRWSHTCYSGAIKDIITATKRNSLSTRSIDKKIKIAKELTEFINYVTCEIVDHVGRTVRAMCKNSSRQTINFTSMKYAIDLLYNERVPPHVTRQLKHVLLQKADSGKKVPAAAATTDTEASSAEDNSEGDDDDEVDESVANELDVDDQDDVNVDDDQDNENVDADDLELGDDEDIDLSVDDVLAD